jgi:hypothetical protein
MLLLLLLLYYIFTTGTWVRSEVPCIRGGAVACFCFYYCFTMYLLQVHGFDLRCSWGRCRVLLLLQLLYYVFTTGAWVRSEVSCIRGGAIACLRQRC